MIMIRIEMWPHGDQSRKRDLAAIAIANIGGDTDTGRYQYWISHQIDSSYGRKWPGHETFAKGGDTPCVWKHGTIDGFRRMAGAVQLLATVLRKAFR